jgi:hypothetical protein
MVIFHSYVSLPEGTCDEFKKHGLSTAKLVNRNEIGDFINMEVEDPP